MPEKLVASLRDRIFRHVEEGLVVCGPGDIVYAFDSLGKDLTCTQVLDLQRVLPIAGIVGAVGEQVSVVTRSEQPDAHELLALGQFVHVDHDFFGRVEIAVLATEGGILFTFLSTRVVEVIAPAIRHA